ncbi:hypothetical protein EIP91_009948 [Steccherinum ochraceum]|uniref:Uncharacterized protein n=1 Tax=Steccherinum ochraceum TaxID=92696 RepID=A0A4R0R3P7_9APHY|nr:hypothetical protein EIP91_009948 [Steccherinum ochraceum]
MSAKSTSLAQINRIVLSRTCTTDKDSTRRILTVELSGFDHIPGVVDLEQNSVGLFDSTFHDLAFQRELYHPLPPLFAGCALRTTDTGDQQLYERGSLVGDPTKKLAVVKVLLLQLLIESLMRKISDVLYKNGLATPRVRLWIEFVFDEFVIMAHHMIRAVGPAQTKLCDAAHKQMGELTQEICQLLSWRAKCDAQEYTIQQAARFATKQPLDRPGGRSRKVPSDAEGRRERSAGGQ